MATARYYSFGEADPTALTEAAAATGMKAKGYQENPPDYSYFDRRKYGKRLCDQVCRGDVVILQSLLGTFHAPQDCVRRLQVWLDLGVRIQILSPPIDTGTPAGNAILQWLMVGIGDSRKMQRPKTSRVKKKKKSRYFPAWGWRPEYSGRGHHPTDMAPCERDRRAARIIQQLHAEGFNWKDIAAQLAVKEIKVKRAGGKMDWLKPREAQSLFLAAEHDFPRVPRDAWLGPERESWLRRATDGDWMPPPQRSRRTETDRGQSSDPKPTEVPE